MSHLGVFGAILLGWSILAAAGFVARCIVRLAGWHEREGE